MTANDRGLFWLGNLRDQATFHVRTDFSRCRTPDYDHFEDYTTEQAEQDEVDTSTDSDYELRAHAANKQRCRALLLQVRGASGESRQGRDGAKEAQDKKQRAESSGCRPKERRRREDSDDPEGDGDSPSKKRHRNGGSATGSGPRGNGLISPSGIGPRFNSGRMSTRSRNYTPRRLQHRAQLHRRKDGG